MKKILMTCGILLMILMIGVVLTVASWTDTKYGRLDYRAAILIKYIEAVTGAQSASFNVAELRKQREEKANKLSGKQEPCASIKDFEIPGPAGNIPVRVYTPEGSGPFPILLYYHGGGWVIGSIHSNDTLARKLARRSGAVTVSVGYRLAPENPFPAAVDDAYAALHWARDHAVLINGDPQRIAVSGDSAGGNLAAIVAQMSKDHGPKIAAQVLLYPVTDVSRMDTESYNHFKKGFFLEKTKMEQFRAVYVPLKENWTDPKVSPLLAENFKGLPPALVITCEFDPLRDEGEAYAEKMKQAGVPVTLNRYKGMIHGFASLGLFLPQADEALNRIGVFLKNEFRK